jgi:hypothetical protein
MTQQTKNDLSAPVPKFCLAVEEFRRTPEGRVRTSQEFLTHFFPHDEKKAKDQLLRFLPNDVRGPILAHWGIRGLKAAVRDSHEKVESVVHDALVAGDVDHSAFELGLPPDVVVRWVPLASWWTFWRGGKLSKKSIHKALETAYDLALFDARWFLDTVEGRGGKLRGTDVIAEGLTKADLTEWIKKIHQTGDGSPRGILAAIGWERLVAQTPNDVLIGALDALAAKVGLHALADNEIEQSLASLSFDPLEEIDSATGNAAKVDLPAASARPGARQTDAPELAVVGETEMGSFSDEGMVVIMEDDGPAPSSSNETALPLSKVLSSAVTGSTPPIGNLERELEKLGEDDEEDAETTAVFSADKNR